MVWGCFSSGVVIGVVLFLVCAHEQNVAKSSVAGFLQLVFLFILFLGSWNLVALGKLR